MTNWRKSARCRGLDPALFFPEERFSPGTAEYEAELASIRSICAECPVRQQCLEAALSHPDDIENGIWAGTTPEQRLAIINERNAQ